MRSYADDHPVTCDTCGGPGGAIDGDTFIAPWFGRKISHVDPQVCSEYLARERQRLDKLRAKLQP